jgi:hypothetical protein
MEEDRAKNDNAALDEGGEAGSAPRVPVKRRRRRWPFVLFGVVVVLPLLVLASWAAIALKWHYSIGNRSGFIQKFSKKGWVCKTWEGELAMVTIPGAAQERFTFSVRDDSVAAPIAGLTGSRVTVTYEEHPGLPTSCFGETNYFVTAVKAIR